MPLWSRLRCWAWSVVPAWPVVIPAAVYLYLVIKNDQIQDALLGAAQDWDPAGDSAWWFYVWTFVFTLTLWFWGRLLLGFTRPIPPGLPPSVDASQVRQAVDWIIDWLPRLVGAAVPIGVAVAIWSATRSQPMVHSDGLIGRLAVGLVIYAVFVLFRRPVARKLSNVLPAGRVAEALRPRPVIPRGTTFHHHLHAISPIARFFAVVWAVASLGATIWSLIDPVGMGQSFGGAVSIVPIGLAGIATGLALAVLITMAYHVPVLAALLLLAVISSYTMDNHQLHAVPPSASSAPALDAAYQAFKRAPNRKLLLIATAGGGIRAAYWTAYALSSLHDEQSAQQKQFDNAVFAISGVSGGSYGAVLYRAMLATEQAIPCADRRPPAPDNHPPTNFADCVYLYLGWDGLGPTVVSLLFPDLQQRFIPKSLLPDRAHALELTWQQAWASRAPDGSQDLLKSAFHGLWKNSPLPVLLLNGTSVRAGHRIITTNVVPGPAATAFHDVVFFSALTDNEIAATTAATNSARFPVISPPGTILGSTGTATDQIVDGGLFENSGAQTLLELYAYITAQSAGRPLDIGVLQITSDPDQPDPAGKCGSPPVTAGAGISRFLPDLLSSPETLLATRSARGTAEVEALQARVQADYHTAHPEKPAGDAPYFAIRLSRKDAPTFAPLGWQLSRAAVNTIQDAWKSDCNAPDLNNLRAWLGFNTSQ